MLIRKATSLGSLLEPMTFLALIFDHVYNTRPEMLLWADLKENQDSTCSLPYTSLLLLSNV